MSSSIFFIGAKGVLKLVDGCGLTADGIQNVDFQHIASCQICATTLVLICSVKRAAIPFSKELANLCFSVENNNPHFEICWFMLQLLGQPTNGRIYFL
jgi:hypothetical protein